MTSDLRTIAALALLAASFAAAAQSPDAILGDAERQRLEGEARALRDQANALRDEAERRYVAEYDACWKKFLVSACMDDAKKARQRRFVEARGVEQKAREIEHDLRKREFARHEAEMAEALPKRDAAAAERAEKNRREQQEALERLERKRLEAEQRDRH